MGTAGTGSTATGSNLPAFVSIPSLFLQMPVTRGSPRHPLALPEEPPCRGPHAGLEDARARQDERHAQRSAGQSLAGREAGERTFGPFEGCDEVLERLPIANCRERHAELVGSRASREVRVVVRVREGRRTARRRIRLAEDDTEERAEKD